MESLTTGPELENNQGHSQRSRRDFYFWKVRVNRRLFNEKGSSTRIRLLVRATGNFTKNASIPLMTSEEFKAAMEQATNVKSGYTAPTATKQ